MNERLILSLCDYTGTWSDPYRNAGYTVVQVDLKHGQDVRLVEMMDRPVHGILCAPPCTHFAGSGARWWASKGEAAVLEGLALIDACCRIVLAHRPQWWVLENPVGRLYRWLGKPRMTFNPNEYGGYLSPPGDAYTKRTCLWGDFTPPIKKPVPPTEGSKMWKLYGGKSDNTKEKRSETPKGFAQAFFESNP